MDFPAPLGPIIPRKSPSLIEKLTLSSALTPGYLTVRSFISTTFNYITPLLDLKDCFPSSKYNQNYLQLLQLEITQELYH